MGLGIFFAVISGLLWGLIFVGPLLIPEYPSILQASGRYIAFGVISLLLSWHDRKRLFALLPQDWIEAIKLVLAGHLLYYTCLASAIQRIGAPISTAIIGTLPVMIIVFTHAITINNHKFDQKLPNHVVIISIFLIGIGLSCINIAELKYAHFAYSLWEYIFGLFLATISVICWAWYAIRNAYWLKTHPYNTPVTWANAQGIVTLPLSCIAYAVMYLYSNYFKNEFVLPFGPRPLFFIILMILIGFCCSWLGTFFWNAASQRLPTTLIGPLIVFETIAGLMYTFIHRRLWPSPLILIGIFLLILGVIFVLCMQNFLYNRK